MDTKKMRSKAYNVPLQKSGISASGVLFFKFYVIHHIKLFLFAQAASLKQVTAQEW